LSLSVKEGATMRKMLTVVIVAKDYLLVEGSKVDHRGLA